VGINIMSTRGNKFTTIEETMSRQYPDDPEWWICPKCINYKDNLVCGKGVLITVVGANMKGCIYFISGKKCIHCGRIT
jgi:hypothetical protein